MASVFSGKAGRNSAIWTAGVAQNQLGELNDIYQQGANKAGSYLTKGRNQTLNALRNSYNTQRSDITTGRDSAIDTTYAGRDAGLGALQQGYDTATGDIRQGYGAGREALNASIDQYQGLVDRGMAGYDMYSNSLGLNGAEGTAAAQNAFQAGPGYQWGVDQATGQAARAANKGGMAMSGNTVDAQTRLAMNLANQEYGGWQNRLQGYQGAAQQAVAGQAGQYNNLATLEQNQGNKLADLATGLGTGQAGLYTDAAKQAGTYQFEAGKGLSQAAANQGVNLANTYTNYGQGMASNATGLATNLAGANSTYYGNLIPAGQQGMMAGQQAAANKMGAIMGGVQMAGQALGAVAGMPVAGGGSVGGNFVSSLWK